MVTVHNGKRRPDYASIEFDTTHVTAEDLLEFIEENCDDSLVISDCHYDVREWVGERNLIVEANAKAFNKMFKKYGLTNGVVPVCIIDEELAEELAGVIKALCGYPVLDDMVWCELEDDAFTEWVEGHGREALGLDESTTDDELHSVAGQLYGEGFLTVENNGDVYAEPDWVKECMRELVSA